MNIKLDIPADFFKGEERCGYYVSPEMKKVWAVELDLIAEFGRVCDKHGLKWWINYGTLLGAVRHKGFIPWDDDVDVVMMREDYEKLCEVYADEFRHPYLLQSPYNHEYRDSIRPCAKLYNEDTALFEPSEAEFLRSGRKIDYSRGIFLDIFPMYDLPDKERDYRRMFRKCTLIKTLTLNLRILSYDYGYTDSKKWKRQIMKSLRFLIKLFNAGTPYTKAFDRFMDAIDSYKCPDSKRVIDWWNIKGRYAFSSLKEMPLSVVLRSCFDGTIQLPFETLTLPAPSGYEELLRHYYGDWHEMKIVPLHGVSYDTEKSYKYYDENGFLPGDEQA